MKLNPDCVRDILLSVENVCDMENLFSFPNDKTELLEKYNNSEIEYHARQCNLAGLLYNYKASVSGGFIVIDLTPHGHEFLANIRDDSIWHDVKEVSAKVGTKSLSSLLQIASGIVSEIIKTQLGIS